MAAGGGTSDGTACGTDPFGLVLVNHQGYVGGKSGDGSRGRGGGRYIGGVVGRRPSVGDLGAILGVKLRDREFRLGAHYPVEIGSGVGASGFPVSAPVLSKDW